MPYLIDWWYYNYIVTPTLGNLAGGSSLVQRIKTSIKVFNWSSTANQYVFYQGTLSTREFALARLSGGLRLSFGGTDTYIFTNSEISTVFGSSTISGLFSLEVDIVAESYTVSIDGSVVKSGTFTAGTDRVDGAGFRISSRPTNNIVGDTGSASVYLSEETETGDIQIYFDTGSGYILERDYVIPSSGITFPDNANGQDGTMYGSFSDSNLVYYAPPVNTPINPSITNLLATSARLNWEQG